MGWRAINICGFNSGNYSSPPRGVFYSGACLSHIDSLFYSFIPSFFHSTVLECLRCVGAGVTVEAAAVRIRVSSSQSTARSGCGKPRRFHCKEVVGGHRSGKAVPPKSEETPEMNSAKGPLVRATQTPTAGRQLQSGMGAKTRRGKSDGREPEG